MQQSPDLGFKIALHTLHWNKCCEAPLGSSNFSTPWQCGQVIVECWASSILVTGLIMHWKYFVYLLYILTYLLLFYILLFFHNTYIIYILLFLLFYDYSLSLIKIEITNIKIFHLKWISKVWNVLLEAMNQMETK